MLELYQSLMVKHLFSSQRSGISKQAKQEGKERGITRPQSRRSVSIFSSMI